MKDLFGNEHAELDEYQDVKRMSVSLLFREKKKFLQFLYKKNGTSYSLDLALMGFTDPDPEWKP